VGVLVDGVDHCGHIGIGSACPMPSIISSFAPESKPRCPCRRRVHQRIDGAVNHERGRRDRVQPLLAAAGGENGAELPADAGRVEPRSKVRSARERSSASSSGKWPTRSTFQVCAKRTKYSSRVVGGGASAPRRPRGSAAVSLGYPSLT